MRSIRSPGTGHAVYRETRLHRCLAPPSVHSIAICILSLQLVQDFGIDQECRRLLPLRVHQTVSQIVTSTLFQLIVSIAQEAQFELPFVGTLHHLLRDHIFTMAGGDGLNHVSIIQSSGSGKSRLIHEVAKLIFSIPLNVRDPGEADRTSCIF